MACHIFFQEGLRYMYPEIILEFLAFNFFFYSNETKIVRKLFWFNLTSFVGFIPINPEYVILVGCLNSWLSSVYVYLKYI